MKIIHNIRYIKNIFLRSLCINQYKCTINQELSYAATQIRSKCFCWLARWQHFLHGMTSWPPSWKLTSNRKSDSALDAYLLEEQSCQISSRSSLKRRSLRLFWRWGVEFLWDTMCMWIPLFVKLAEIREKENTKTQNAYKCTYNIKAIKNTSCIFQHLTGRVRSTRLRPISLFGC